jgi:hypothetical protein
VTCQKLPRAQWWSHAITLKSLGTNIIKSCAGKRYWPHLRVRRLSRGGYGGHCRYPVDRVPLCTTLKRSAPRLQIRSRCQRALALPRAPRHRACNPPEGGSSVATCPMAQSKPPARKGLWCHHVPRGTVRAIHQERAPVFAKCPEAPNPSPDRRRLRSHRMPHVSRPAPYAGRLWRRHVTEALGPPHGRASVPPRVLWLQTCLLVQEGFRAATCPVTLGPQVCLCVPKTPDIRLIMASPGTRCRQRIKCIYDRSYAAYGRH